MTLNVDTFKTKLPGAGARANLFHVELKETVTGVDTAFWIKAGQIPGSTVGILPINHAGRVMKLPGLRTFDDWTCTVINDEAAQIKKFMIEWMVQMSGDMAGERDKTKKYGKKGYKHEDIKIAQYSSNSTKKQEYTIHKAWPNAIADTPVDWGTDGLQEFTLTFSYDYFSHTKGGTTIKLEGNTTTGAPVTSAA